MAFSKTGNAFTFIDYLENFELKPCDILRLSYSNTDDIDVEEYDNILLVTSTWSNGKIPKNCKNFVIDNATKYKKKWIIVGTGNSIFVNFCGAVDGISKILLETNNEIIKTFRYEQRFNYLELDEQEKEIVNSIVRIVEK